MIILVGILAFIVGNISMYHFMCGEVDEAWSVARRTAQEKEHWRLHYERLKDKTRKNRSK